MNWRFWIKKPKYECHCMQEYLDQADAPKTIEVEITFPDGSTEKCEAREFWQTNARWWDAQTAHIPFADLPPYTD